MVSVSWFHFRGLCLVQSLTNKGVIVSNYQVDDKFGISWIASIGLLEQIYGSDAFYCDKTHLAGTYIETYRQDSSETHESDFNTSECNADFGGIVYF